MEQRRFDGKSQWYHETQSCTRPQEVLPLVPEAAHVDDRFLLDLTIADETLRPFHSWLQPARQLAGELFPAHVTLNRLHTFSAYERMSTALTVAQVCGVQRLCNHYAARLAPLPGPDSSRESNHRLAQITQYARQLACSPSVIDERARQHLADVGLSTWDVVLFNQIIGFVGFQARVVAIFQAWAGQPVRWMPGLSLQSYADASLFDVPETDWHPAYQPPEAQPLASLSLPQTAAALRSLAPVLGYQPTLLALLDTLLQSSLHGDTAEHTFGALLSARINGSVSCFNELASQGRLSPDRVDTLRQSEREIEHRERQHPVERPLSQAIQLLTRAPDRFSAAQLAPLIECSVSVNQAVNLAGWCALCGWLNRLKIALGETR